MERRHWSGRPLRKHQSQIRRLVEQLGGMADALQEHLEHADGAPAQVLSQARDNQLRVLEIHRLWDYYRAKLSLRYVPYFRPFLAAADDFAWECYEPARMQAVPVEAAPLVFLSDDFSPYTRVGQDGYEVAELPGALDSAQFRDIAAELPVPVIGVPWYQVTHLPDAPAIGHEVGHDLELELDSATPSAHTPRARCSISSTRNAGSHGVFGWRRSTPTSSACCAPVQRSSQPSPRSRHRPRADGRRVAADHGGSHIRPPRSGSPLSVRN